MKSAALRLQTLCSPVLLFVNGFEEACRNQEGNIVDAGNQRHRRWNCFVGIAEEQRWEPVCLET